MFGVMWINALGFVSPDCGFYAFMRDLNVPKGTGWT